MTTRSAAPRRASEVGRPGRILRAGVEQGGVVSGVRSSTAYPGRRPAPASLVARATSSPPAASRAAAAPPRPPGRGRPPAPEPLHDAYAHDRGESGVSRPAPPSRAATGLKKGTRSPKGKAHIAAGQDRARGPTPKPGGSEPARRGRSRPAPERARRGSISGSSRHRQRGQRVQGDAEPTPYEPQQTLAMPRAVTVRGPHTNRLAKGDTREVRRRREARPVRYESRGHRPRPGRRARGREDYAGGAREA